MSSWYALRPLLTALELRFISVAMPETEKQSTTTTINHPQTTANRRIIATIDGHAITPAAEVMSSKSQVRSNSSEICTNGIDTDANTVC